MPGLEGGRELSHRIDFVRGVDAIAPGLSRAQEPLLACLSQLPCYDVRSVQFSRLPGRLLFPFVYGALPLWLQARGSDLLHIANSWYAQLVPVAGRPAVVTCHDLIELQAARSGQVPIRPHRRFHAEAAFRGMTRARIIACDSAAVAAQVRDLAPGCDEKIRVVYLGIGSRFCPGRVDPATLQRLGASQLYVLYVGSEQSRKNLPRLVEAVAAARRQAPDLHFVKVGGHQTEAGRAELHDALRRHGMMDHAVVIDHVTDENLIALYRGACATALVSLQEGFGFPALEAMASGSPVVVSNRDSLPEVTGGKALVVDPLDVGDIALALERVALDENLRRRLQNEGARHAAAFTWEKTALAYAELYREALGLTCA